MIAGNSQCLQLLLDAGASPDASPQGDDPHSVPILAAARSNQLECMRLLVDRRCDVNAVGPFGETALHIAAAVGRDALTRLLLSIPSTKVDCQMVDGMTAVLMAAASGSTACLRLLVDAKASLSVATNEGATAVFMCAQEGKAGCLRLLLAAGADGARTRDDGVTPAMIAQLNGRLECLEMLREAGGGALG